MPEVETFTPEESAALEAMQADTAPVEDTPEPEAPQAVPEAPAEAPAAIGDAPASDPAQEPAKAPPSGFVPIQAMDAERAKRKAVEARIAELEAAMAAMPKPEPIDPIANMPDPILDPKAFARWQGEQLKARDEKIEGFLRERQQEAEVNRRAQLANHLEQTFMAQTPDYPAAVEHVVNNRKLVLAAYGYEPDRITQIIAAEANTLFDTATAEGKNPAEVLYQVAKASGWQAKTHDPAPDPIPIQQATAQVVALKQAQANAGTLATASGPSQSGQYTVEQLSRMSEADLAKLPKDVFRRVMGG